IRDAFLQFMRSAFPRLEQAEPIELEKHIPALRLRGGFADALYGDLIFEFKRRIDDGSRAEGKDELTRYIHNQRHPERFLGILTDGETLEVYALRNDHLERVDQLTLSLERADEAKLWLDCYLFHEKNLVPTANDVALRFGQRSPTFWHSLRVLRAMWRKVDHDPTAQTKFLEWQSLLSIVYGSAVGEESLFLRHTYLALFARGLAFAALERRAPNADEVAGIITGETFERMGFENFVGDDFFTWMTDPNVFQPAQGVLHSVATRLTAACDLGAVHEDLLKELYQELVDPQTRHDLGEFYTPDWLAELTLRKAGFPPSKQADAAAGSLLDPACGSGTFLFTAVRLLREAGCKGKALVEFCTQHLAGLDVHPLAVTIAK
ncbi:MAG TPA: SAM-dependent DNA methyltransferase, partial [Planctomycetaceae bacterium]|nr:SAM-dependent DNA methyltransferase [Planctomycetaceae bacterium]